MMLLEAKMKLDEDKPNWISATDDDQRVRVVDVVKELRSRYDLPPACELRDAQLARLLWKILDFCARMHIWIVNTGGYSDRELYVELLDRYLVAPFYLEGTGVSQIICVPMRNNFADGEDTDEYVPIFLRPQPYSKRDVRIEMLCSKYLKKPYPKLKVEPRIMTLSEYGVMMIEEYS